MWRKNNRRIVFLAEFFHMFRFGNRPVISRHMIGYKIYENIQTGIMRTRNQFFKFLHSFLHIYRQIRIHIVTIPYCIGRARFPFYNLGKLPRNTVFGIIGGRSMGKHPNIPNMGITRFFQFVEHYVGDIVKFTRPIFFNRSMRFIP